MVGLLHGVWRSVISSVYQRSCLPRPEQFSAVAGESSSGDVFVATAIAGHRSFVLILPSPHAFCSPWSPGPSQPCFLEPSLEEQLDTQGPEKVAVVQKPCGRVGEPVSRVWLWCRLVVLGDSGSEDSLIWPVSGKS